MTRARIGRFVRVSALVAGAALALGGCGMHPGAAAVVGDTTISGSEVDDAAAALCTEAITGAEARGEAKPDLASRAARQAAVGLLIDSELSRQFAEEKGVEPDKAALSNAFAQNAQTIEQLPEENREGYRNVLEGYVSSQLVLAEIGRESLGDPNAAEDAARAEGARLRGKWAKSVDIEVDPRFGTYDKGTLTATSGSLSFPASERAAAGANPEPAANWVAGLPMSQKCG